MERVHDLDHGPLVTSSSRLKPNPRKRTINGTDLIILCKTGSAAEHRPVLIKQCSFLALNRATYWKRRGIPCPDGKLFSGNLDKMFWEELRLFQLAKWTEQYGKMYGLLTGFQPMLVISDPTMVHELLTSKFEYFHSRTVSSLEGDVDKDPRMNLVNARGARWKRLRAIANPAFSISNLKKPNAPINLHRFFVEMTYDVIARVAMGQRESRQFQSEDAKLAVHAFQRLQNNWFEYLAMLFPWLGPTVLRPILLLTVKMRRDPLLLLTLKIREQNVKHGNADQTESDQQQQQRGPDDFIDMFLDAVKDEGSIEYRDELGVFNKAGTKVDRTNTVDEIEMQLQVFLLAGFNLACHPEVQLHLQEEIATVCISENPTYEELNRLKYTEAVIKETLRLMPIAAAGETRLCSQTTKLGEFLVEKGTGVAVDVYSFHRNKELWGEDADEFRPERWLDNDFPPASAHFYAFGGGPRICIGMRFALLEEKMALVRLLRRYSLVKTEQTEKLLKFNSQVVLNPGAVMVKLSQREENF
ncbi:hypothetical protein niasHS_004398 [Heterodera schachtii]|uniref:Cytochrome P450 n=1 Tax=Heterodera schachtii TaxID=97005 RepID=A0ABD2JKU6_HETSC